MINDYNEYIHQSKPSEKEKSQIWQTASSTTNEGGQKGDTGGREKWSDNVSKLLDLIVKKPTITRKELSEALHINQSAIQKHIEKLKKEGVIFREGSDKKGFWKVIAKGGNNE